MECDYYSRFVREFEWEFTGLLTPPTSPPHRLPQKSLGQLLPHDYQLSRYHLRNITSGRIYLKRNSGGGLSYSGKKALAKTKAAWR
jgi:hypothetical protein